MGLDALDMVFRLEEEFDIELSDEAVERIITVRDVVDLCHSYVEPAFQACWTSTYFFALRTAAREVVGDPKLDIRPESEVAGTIPPALREPFWNSIQQLTGRTVPGLQRPFWIGYSVAAAALVSACSVFLSPQHLAIGLPLALLIACISLIFTARSALAHTRSPKVVPPSSCATFGDLTAWLRRGVESTKLTNDRSYRGTSARVRSVLSDVTGVGADAIELDQKLVDDLGLG